jgi:hypothetical protein
VPATPENGWRRDVTSGFMTRIDNSASRVGDAIHKAVKQLAASHEPRVLVLVNDASMDFLDLHEALNGYIVFGTSDTGYFKNTAGMKVADGRIRDEKGVVDLYVWINRYEGRVPSRVDGQPLEPHAQPNRPMFVCTTQEGYELARAHFGVPETPKPTTDPDAGIPTLRELLLQEAAGKRR